MSALEGFEMIKAEALYSSKTDEWSTPQDFYDHLDAEFHFNLDPCADEYNHKCEKYFTKEQDGLLQNWGGIGCSVIPLMDGISASGLKKPMRKAGSLIPLWLCLFLPGQIQNIFMSGFTGKQR